MAVASLERRDALVNGRHLRRQRLRPVRGIRRGLRGSKSSQVLNERRSAFNICSKALCCTAAGVFDD